MTNPTIHATFVGSGPASANARLLCLLLMAIVFVPSASARGATLAADLRFILSTSTDVTGYVVHVGDSPGVASGGTATALDIGMNYQLVNGVGHVPLGTLMSGSSYVAMQAYDSEGLYSSPSNEIYVSIDPPPAGCAADADCADGDACNGAEACVAGACVAGEALACSAAGPCQAGWCDVASGCRVSAVADGTACDDGDSGTSADTCQAGVCSGTVVPLEPEPEPEPDPDPEPDPISPSVDPDQLVYDDFEDVVIGESPPGWVVSDAAGSLMRWTLEVFPDSDGNAVYGALLLLDRLVLGHFDDAGSDTWSNYEYIGRMKAGDDDSTIGVTVLSTQLEGGGHIALVHDPARPGFVLEQTFADAAGSLWCGTGSESGYVPQPGAWSIFRVRVISEAGGLRVQASVWDQRDVAPADWPIDCVLPDWADRTGRPGVIAGGPGVKLFDDLGVWRIDASQSDSEVIAPLFADDFDEHLPGEDPDGWVDATPGRFVSSPGQLFRVEHDAASQPALFYGGRGRGMTSHVDVAAASDWSDYEVTGRMMVPRLASRLGMLLYSQIPQGEGAIGLIRTRWYGSYRIAVLGVPGARCEGISRTGVVPTAGEWSRFRLRATTNSDGSVRVLARLWRDGSAEPADWQADCTSTHPGTPTSGTIAVWSRGGGPKYWDDLVVRSIGRP